MTPVNSTHDDAEPPLSRDVRQLLTSGPTARASLEDDVVRRLRSRGALRPARRSVRLTSSLVAAALAAGIAFVAGLSVGRARAERPRLTTTIDVAGSRVAIEAAPDAPAVAILRDALASAVLPAPLTARVAPTAAPVPQPAAPAVTWF